MKNTSFSHANLNSFYELQEKITRMISKIDSSETVYFKGYEVDSARMRDILSTISGSIEELYEFTQF